MRRMVRLALVLVVGLLAAGCGSWQAPRDSAPGDVQYGDPGGSPTTGPAPDGATDTTAPAAGSPTGGASSVPPTARPPGTTRSPAPTPTSEAEEVESTTSAPAPADPGSLGPPGAFARTLLRPRPATVISVERFHQQAAEPSSSSISYAGETLRKVTGKDVDVRDSIRIPGSGQSWTADEIRSTADRYSRVTQGGSYAVLRVLFLGGSFEGNDSVLGVAVRGDTLAIFSDSVDGATTPVLSGATIEEAVLVHELGHVLGLVDLARNTGRADPEHPGHSPNPRSVMYWAVESDLIGQVLTGPPPREFDEADLADLRALRDGAE